MKLKTYLNLKEGLPSEYWNAIKVKFYDARMDELLAPVKAELMDELIDMGLTVTPLRHNQFDVELDLKCKPSSAGHVSYADYKDICKLCEPKIKNIHNVLNHYGYTTTVDIVPILHTTKVMLLFRIEPDFDKSEKYYARIDPEYKQFKDRLRNQASDENEDTYKDYVMSLIKEGDESEADYRKAKGLAPKKEHDKKPNDADRVLVYMPHQKQFFWFMTSAPTTEKAISNARFYLVKKYYGFNPAKLQVNLKKLQTDHSPRFYVDDAIHQDVWDKAKPLRS